MGKERAPALEPTMSAFSTPPIDKPITVQLLDKVTAENGEVTATAPLILIDCKENLGFAGGNNVGLRFALGQADMADAWLLNNDTVTDPYALTTLREKCTDPSVGMVGSTLVYYRQPNKVQAYGGARFFPRIGTGMHIGRFLTYRRNIPEAKVEIAMDYVVGASMLVTRPFLNTIGLMSEDYFLYYEEVDWAFRSRNHYRLAYASKSIVYHKVGATIGSSKLSSQRSLSADYYLMSNRIKVTNHFHPRYLGTVKLYLFIEILIRLIHGRRDHAVMIWQLINRSPTKP
jgi:GT2 family glycosyltransferase